MAILKSHRARLYQKASCTAKTMGCTCCKKTPSHSQHEENLLRTNLLASMIALSEMAQHGIGIYRLSDYTYKKRIGSGRFGVVYSVVNRYTSRHLAMKEVPRRHEMYTLEPRLEKEHLVLGKLKSCWLVEMFHCFETSSKHYMVLEHLPGPNLVRVAKDGCTSPLLLMTYAAEMLMAIQSVHHYGYMHRDIKLSNFLLNANERVKLIDFGSCIRFLPADSAEKVFPMDSNLRKRPSREVQRLRHAVLSCRQFRPFVPHGTPCYCAPEVICLATRKPSATDYSYLCDYWSLGVCLYYLFFGKLPFYSDERVKIASLVLNWPTTLKFPKAKKGGWDFSQVISLIRGLLQGEETRLGKKGVHHIASHPFFKTQDWMAFGHEHKELMEKHRRHRGSEKLRNLTYTRNSSHRHDLRFLSHFAEDAGLDTTPPPSPAVPWPLLSTVTPLTSVPLSYFARSSIASSSIASSTISPFPPSSRKFPRAVEERVSVGGGGCSRQSSVTSILKRSPAAEGSRKKSTSISWTPEADGAAGVPPTGDGKEVEFDLPSLSL